MERVTLVDRQGMWALVAADRVADAVITAAGGDLPERDEPDFPVVEDELARLDRLLNGEETTQDTAPDNNAENRAKLLGLLGR